MVKYLEKNIYLYTLALVLPVLWYFLGMMLFPKDYDSEDYLDPDGRFQLFRFNIRWRKTFYFVQIMYALASLFFLLFFYNQRDMLIQILFIVFGVMFLLYALLEKNNSEWIYKLLLAGISVFIFMYFLLTGVFLANLSL